MLWEEKARQDKARYHVEKSRYTGPWRVQKKKRCNLDIGIPKRPMSAFLAFSHCHRAEAKKKHPELSNNQITRLLAKQWKVAPDDEKKKFIEQECALRQKYLEDITCWRQNQKYEHLTQRQKREEMALKEVADREKEVSPEDVEYCHVNIDSSDHDYYPSVQNPPWSSYYYCRDGGEAKNQSNYFRPTYTAESLVTNNRLHACEGWEEHYDFKCNWKIYPNHYSQIATFHDGFCRYPRSEGVLSECDITTGYQGK
jgi:hypothetical protein